MCVLAVVLPARSYYDATYAALGERGVATAASAGQDATRSFRGILPPNRFRRSRGSLLRPSVRRGMGRTPVDINTGARRPAVILPTSARALGFWGRFGGTWWQAPAASNFATSFRTIRPGP